MRRGFRAKGTSLPPSRNLMRCDLRRLRKCKPRARKSRRESVNATPDCVSISDFPVAAPAPGHHRRS
jgi:hypothetical protein